MRPRPVDSPRIFMKLFTKLLEALFIIDSD